MHTRPTGLAVELSPLIRAGYRVIGQRWTALRERDRRSEMLHLPGVVQRRERRHGCAGRSE